MGLTILQRIIYFIEEDPELKSKKGHSWPTKDISLEFPKA